MVISKRHILDKYLTDYTYTRLYHIFMYRQIIKIIYYASAYSGIRRADVQKRIDAYYSPLFAKHISGTRFDLIRAYSQQTAHKQIAVNDTS